MEKTNNSPVILKENFLCPNCGVVARQEWINSKNLGERIVDFYSHTFLDYRKNIQDYKQTAIEDFLNTIETKLSSNIESLFPNNLRIAICNSCSKYSLWIGNRMVFPKLSFIEDPNQDMDEEIQILYKEARDIFENSPKGATALLRLCLQKTLIQVGQEGKNINEDIKKLVEQGLSPKIQKSLDILRVVGNNAVHPGQIDLDDNKEVALKLFKILNMIVDDMVTKPKEIDCLYEEIIPEKTKQHINDRDGVK